MTTVTLEGTQELMKARETAVILATGGMGLVRAAYSAGKPAYGVGPGNAPAFIERTADVAKAVRDIVTGKTFDNGVLCSSENSVVVDAPLVEEVKRAFRPNGGYFMSAAEIDAVGRILVSPQRLPNPALVGRPAAYIAQQAGITVPEGTRVLIAELAGVGRDFPLSIEKLCPVLSFYVVERLARGLRALQADPAIWRHGPHDVDPLPQRRHHSAVRSEETRLPHRRQLADDAWVDRADDRTGSGDDAGLRRLRRKHHVGQHLAAAPAEHQAPRVRDHAGGRPPQDSAPAAGTAAQLPEGAGRSGPGGSGGRVAGPPDRPVPGLAGLHRPGWPGAASSAAAGNAPAAVSATSAFGPARATTSCRRSKNPPTSSAKTM